MFPPVQVGGVLKSAASPPPTGNSGHAEERQSRKDLGLASLKWCVSQQPPTDDTRLNGIDVTAQLEQVAAADQDLIHIKAFDLPPQEKQLVLDTAGVVELGELIARSYLATTAP